MGLVARSVAFLLFVLAVLPVGAAATSPMSVGFPAVQSAAATEPASPQPSPVSYPHRGPLYHLLRYFPSRVADLLDIVKCNVGLGLGLCVNVRPTKSLQAGFGAYDSVRIGLRGRRLPFWHEWSSEGGFDGLYWEGGETERGFYEFGGTVHFLIIGLEAALDIEETLDFGLGWFGNDPADDDFR
ncbi:MAG: hypothetical protein N3D11_00330 [Candidatus Sumerlaeia bacterium]|nr:hypothetical protein [Candidatus Sumerlaeia bacterium]